MKKRTTKLLAIIISILMLMQFTVISNAQHSDGNFSDLEKSHWAYDEAKAMVELGIIEQESGNRFNPKGLVTKEVFARMMVKALDLNLKNPSTPSFIDVPKSSRYYKYIETARFYLTYYETQSGKKYKPSDYAVREDMAVALIKAMGSSPLSDFNAILSSYADADEITNDQMRTFVAAIIENKIMIGYDKNGVKTFKPQNPLTRAEAAVLLYNTVNPPEKTTDEAGDKTTDGGDVAPPVTDNTNKTANVTATVKNHQLYLNWNSVNSNDFKYYKVVFSKYVANPVYSKDGYAKAISNVNTTSCTINPYDHYNGGDLGGKIVPGQKYYVSITAVYEGDNRIAGNAVEITMPGTAQTTSNNPSSYTPVLKGSATGSNIYLDWSEVCGDNFSYYKVVFSKGNPKPIYPADGYAKYISNCSSTAYTVSPDAHYNGNNDFGGKIKSGETYYVSITACYKHGKYASNTVKLTMP